MKIRLEDVEFGASTRRTTSHVLRRGRRGVVDTKDDTVRGFQLGELQQQRFGIEACAGEGKQRKGPGAEGNLVRSKQPYVGNHSMPLISCMFLDLFQASRATQPYGD